MKFLCFLVVPLASVFIWTSVGESANSNHGVELKTVKILPDATLDYVLVKKLRGRVRILATSSSSNAKQFNYDVDESMTISQFAKKSKATAAVSGGYLSSFSPPRSLGLVRITGANTGSPTRTWIGAGMFCIKGSKYIVSEFDLNQAAKFSDCLQSGPLLLRDGAVKYESEDVDVSSGERILLRSAQQHPFVCITTTGDLVIGVSSEMKLDDFAEALKDKVHCTDALGLSGGGTTGLYFGQKVSGNDDFPLANMIAVFD